jgi:osmotically-inducible protein OsmY
MKTTASKMANSPSEKESVGSTARNHRWHEACVIAKKLPAGKEKTVMSRTLSVVALFAMVLVAVSGCQSMTGKTAGETVDDTTITASVKGKLVAEKVSNLTRVNVDTNRGTVYLNGIVETPEQKARAEQLAWQAKGVKSVVNNLQVQKR